MGRSSSYLGYQYIPPVVFLLSLPFAHTVALRLTSLFLFMLIAIKYFFSEKRKKPYCIETLAIWLLLALFSLYNSVDFYYSLGEIKTEVIYGLVCFLSFYFFTKTEDVLRIFVYTVFISVLAASVWAIFSHINQGGWVRDATFGGVGGLSTVIITTLPTILFAGFVLVKQHAEIPYRMIIAILFTSLMASIIWAGYWTKNIMFWPALTVQLTILLLLLPIPRKKVILIVTIPILVLSLIYGMYLVGSQKGRMADFSVTSIARMLSKDPRTPVWRNVIEKISESPLQGKGFGRATLGKAYPNISNNPVFWHSHNIFLDAGIQMGIPGILALISIFVCLGWFFYRLRRFGDNELQIISAVGIAIIVGVVMKNLSDSFFNRHWALLFWAQMGMLMGYASTKLSGHLHTSNTNRFPSRL